MQQALPSEHCYLFASYEAPFRSKNCTVMLQVRRDGLASSHTSPPHGSFSIPTSIHLRPIHVHDEAKWVANTKPPS